MKRDVQDLDDLNMMGSVTCFFNMGRVTYLLDQTISLPYRNSIAGRFGRVCRHPDEI